MPVNNNSPVTPPEPARCPPHLPSCYLLFGEHLNTNTKVHNQTNKAQVITDFHKALNSRSVVSTVFDLGVELKKTEQHPLVIRVQREKINCLEDEINETKKDEKIVGISSVLS